MLSSVSLTGPPLFRGCEAVYVDFGLNVGRNFEVLYHPERFQRPKLEPHRSLREAFGNTSAARARVCAAGFEPNPTHAPALQGLQRRLTAGGRHVHIFGAAVTDIAAMPPLRFFTDTAEHNMRGHQTGNSLLRWAANMDLAHSTLVPTVHFEWFLREHLGSAGAAWPVVLKMDVEGAEYAVLPPAVGALCRHVDVLLLERHDRFFKASWRGHNPAFGTNTTPPRELSAALVDVRRQHVAGKCRTRVKVVDFP